MADSTDRIRDHYQGSILDEDAMITKIASMLDQMGGPVTAERLATFDQFHVGGLTATAELAKRVGLTANLRVLDAGSGLGGPSRYLAETSGCDVIGIDLAPAYVRISELLAERAGISAKLRYQVGSITALPFEDASFDLVWTQHVVMNIADRDGLYREIRRVLKPGGRFAFYDPYAPEHVQPPLHYPVPWAETEETTTLLTQAQTLTSLERAGLRKKTWDDVSELAKSWIKGQQAQLQQAAQPGFALSPGLVVGARMQPMVANFARNIFEGRVQLVMGVFEAI